MKFSSFGVQALLGLVSVAVSSCNFALATEHEDTAAECDNIGKRQNMCVCVRAMYF